MTDTDDLRDKFVRTLRRRRPMTDARTADVLMPVVRKALADAWDEGHAMGSELGQDTFDRNPWREDDRG